MIDNKHTIKGILSGFVSLIIIFFIAYAITRKDSDNAKMTGHIPSDVHKVERNLHKEANFTNKKRITEKTLKDLNPFGVEERSKELLRPKEYKEADDALKGVGLSVDELRALHTRQDREIEETRRDMDSLVIPPSKEGNPGITLGELLALHEQQRVEIEKAYNKDEIVIPASKDGYPGLSKNELIMLHEQQKRELENKNDWDEIVIPASKDGYPGLSKNELTILQDQQNYEIWEDIDNLYEPVAPLPVGGGPNLTVQEIKELHKRQSINR